MRIEARSDTAEAGLTLATALEHLPDLSLSPGFAEFLISPSPTSALALGGELMMGVKPFDADYARHVTLAVDGATELGPLQISVEASHSPARTLYRTSEEAPLFLESERVSLTNIAVRVEYLDVEEWLLAVEGFQRIAGDSPSEAGQVWLGFEGNDIAWGALAMARFTPGDGDWRFELAALVTGGPSVLLFPRIEWRPIEDFFVEVGAAFIEGPALGEDPRDWHIGSTLDGNDQVFIGVRWLP